jgi:hypothetical protein
VELLYLLHGIFAGVLRARVGTCVGEKAKAASFVADKHYIRTAEGRRTVLEVL